MIIVVDCVSFTSLMLNLNVDREECGMQHIAAFHMFYWQQCSATISRENNQQPLQTINVAFRSLSLSLCCRRKNLVSKIAFSIGNVHCALYMCAYFRLMKIYIYIYSQRIARQMQFFPVCACSNRRYFVSSAIIYEICLLGLFCILWMGFVDRLSSYFSFVKRGCVMYALALLIFV